MFSSEASLPHIRNLNFHLCVLSLTWSCMPSRVRDRTAPLFIRSGLGVGEITGPSHLLYRVDQLNVTISCIYQARLPATSMTHAKCRSTRETSTFLCPSQLFTFPNLGDTYVAPRYCWASGYREHVQSQAQHLLDLTPHLRLRSSPSNANSLRCDATKRRRDVSSLLAPIFPALACPLRLLNQWSS